MNYGQENQYLTARSLGLAGSGSASDDANFSVLNNPALVVNATSWLNLNIGTTIYKLEEDRSFPYYDNFGGFVDYGSYVFNKNWYEGFYGILTSRLPFPSLFGLSFSTGYIPYQDFNYDYLEEVRSDFFGDALLAYNIFSSEGSLYAIPLNLGFTPYSSTIFDKKVSVSAGIGLNILTGSIKQNWRIETKDPSLTQLDSEINIKRDLENTPLVPTVGLRITVGERFAIGSTTRLPYDIKFSQDTSFFVNGSIDKNQLLSYPLQQIFGMDYRFQNILTARVFLDFIYTYWENFEDSWNESLNFDNTFNVRAGVEHIFFNKVPFRVGFNYTTLRESKNYSKTLLAIGSGFYLDQIRFDLAAGVSSLQYFQRDLYDNANYGLESSTEADRIKWNELYARIDLNYAF